MVLRGNPRACMESISPMHLCHLCAASSCSADLWFKPFKRVGAIRAQGEIRWVFCQPSHQLEILMFAAQSLLVKELLCTLYSLQSKHVQTTVLAKPAAFRAV